MTSRVPGLSSPQSGYADTMGDHRKHVVRGAARSRPSPDVMLPGWARRWGLIASSIVGLAWVASRVFGRTRGPEEDTVDAEYARQAAGISLAP